MGVATAATLRCVEYPTSACHGTTITCAGSKMYELVFAVLCVQLTLLSSSGRAGQHPHVLASHMELCLQMDNTKLGEVLNDGSSAPPFQVCASTV
jgi:hypothetical protein